MFSPDRSQFTSTDFTQILTEHGVSPSMEGRRRCLDNVFIERLWRSVKYEEVYLKAYEHGAQIRRPLHEYFLFYNQHRRHQGLDRHTPDQVYSQNQPLPQAA